MISSEALQVCIIVGNIVALLIIYRLIDRKVDRKIMKYWRQIKASEEGQNIFALVKEAKNLIKSEDAQNIFKEAKEVLSEFRAVLKRFKESTEVSEDNDENDEESLLPTLT